METQIQIDRSKVTAAIAKAERAQIAFTDAEQINRVAQIEKQAAILEFLGVTPESAVAPIAENVYNYADNSGVDPRWFATKVNDILHSVTTPEPLPEHYNVSSTDPTEHFNWAIGLIKGEHHGSIAFYKQAEKSLHLSAIYAITQNQLEPGDETRQQSVLSNWAVDNLQTIYDHQRASWFRRY